MSLPLHSLQMFSFFRLLLSSNWKSFKYRQVLSPFKNFSRLHIAQSWLMTLKIYERVSSWRMPVWPGSSPRMHIKWKHSIRKIDFRSFETYKMHLFSLCEVAIYAFHLWEMVYSETTAINSFNHRCWRSGGEEKTVDNELNLISK